MLLRCRGPSWCSPSWPLDPSATIDNLCTDPNQMRPLDNPPSRTVSLTTPRTEGIRPHAEVRVSSLSAAPSIPFGIVHGHDIRATSIPLLWPHKRCRWCDRSRANNVACFGGTHGRSGAAQPWLKMNDGHAGTINVIRPPLSSRSRHHALVLRRYWRMRDDGPAGSEQWVHVPE